MAVSAVTAGRMQATGSQSLPFIVAASSFGTLIEWYDFYTALNREPENLPVK
jgi:hypothetical protein